MNLEKIFKEYECVFREIRSRIEEEGDVMAVLRDYSYLTRKTGVSFMTMANYVLESAERGY
ncbi:MAG: hypothetical protein Q8P81_04115 [Nanoarchaeota archaeon]|nr:hypothetical protein [Nanoarchaeota archaeon]